MSKRSFTIVVLGTALASIACRGDSASSTASGSTGMTLGEVSNGFGQLVPFTTFRLDPVTEQPTTEVVSIRTEAELFDNVNGGNPIRPVPQWERSAKLPSGEPGNHFVYASFTQELDIATVLDPSPAGQATGGLTGTVTVSSLDPITGESIPLRGRVFVDGMTYGGPVQGTPPQLQLHQWVQLDPVTGAPVPVAQEDGSQPGLGFPGTEGIFNGMERLIGKNVITFVADTDDDLTTYETFPEGRQIRFRISTAVRSTGGNKMDRTVLASSTVGPDFLGPEVGRTPPPLNNPLIAPGSGETDIDPLTTLRIEFTEPVQPLVIGDFDDGSPPKLSAAVRLEFGPDDLRTQMPFSIRPISVFDMSTFELIPVFNFPGSGPVTIECATFSKVDINVAPGIVEDLARNVDPDVEEEVPGTPNTNLLAAATFFVTGEGPGMVNAPVAPDVIYAGRLGAVPGVSVVDLNGWGQSTGNPAFDPTLTSFTEGDTYFPLNPNVRFQGAQIRPPLFPGTCTIDGGSAGVFTLTRDSSLGDLLARPPLVSSTGDMMIGSALDGTFNNAPFPFGCQSGGGNLCAIDGQKIVNPFPNGLTLIPAPIAQFGFLGAGAPNLITWAPHPNPPKILFPPLCVAPFLNTQEPTSIDVGPASATPLPNLLGPADPFGDPTHGVPPTGLLALQQNVHFTGPSIPQPQLSACLPFMVRQQIGHYLYMIDRQRREIVVLNSNRMTVIDRLLIPDPTSLAMAPNVDFLAVTSQVADTVAFIDIDPNSASLHEIVHTTVVGNGPRGIAWQPDNEDILVCNEVDSSLSVISAHSLDVRLSVNGNLTRPFDVAVAPRQNLHGHFRGVYFAYILNRNGNVGLFESGPNGVNGWGFDNIVGIAPFKFQNPKAVQVDPVDLRAAVYIAHEGPIDLETGREGPVGEPAVSKLAIATALTGRIPLSINSFLLPQLRDLGLDVISSIGGDALSGIPVDIALDDQLNWGGWPSVQSVESAGFPAPANAKQLIRVAPGGVIVPAYTPRFMFLAIPNPIGTTGVIDVFDLFGTGSVLTDTNPFQPGVQSVSAPNVNVIANYFRQ